MYHHDVISIHALREEGDSYCFEGAYGIRHFYPRPPRGGRRQDMAGGRAEGDISIHALREEGDRRRRCAASWA